MCQSYYCVLFLWGILFLSFSTLKLHSSEHLESNETIKKNNSSVNVNVSKGSTNLNVHGTNVSSTSPPHLGRPSGSFYYKFDDVPRRPRKKSVWLRVLCNVFTYRIFNARKCQWISSADNVLLFSGWRVRFWLFKNWFKQIFLILFMIVPRSLCSITLHNSIFSFGDPIEIRLFVGTICTPLPKQCAETLEKIDIVVSFSFLFLDGAGLLFFYFFLSSGFKRGYVLMHF